MQSSSTNDINLYISSTVYQCANATPVRFASKTALCHRCKLNKMSGSRCSAAIDPCIKVLLGAGDDFGLCAGSLYSALLC